MNERQEPVHIVGAGPCALVAALRLACAMPVVLHVRAQASSGTVDNIEAVPAPMLALLLELGVPASLLGVRRLYTASRFAWRNAQPERVVGRACAHLPRPCLESALLACAMRHRRIHIESCTAGAETGFPQGLQGIVIDATGRRAVSAVRRHRVASGPVARCWIARASLPPEDQLFCLAVHAGGYVYRMASDEHVLMAWCGSTLQNAAPQHWSELLQAAHANWLALPHISAADWQPGKAAAVGVSWAEPGPGAVLLGDAAYGRDALGSQGVAIAMRDALHFSNVICGKPRGAWADDRHAMFLTHLARLHAHIGTMRFSDAPYWRAYRADLAHCIAHLSGTAPWPSPAVRQPN